MRPRCITIAVLAMAMGSVAACSRTDQKPVDPSGKVTFAYTVLPDAALAQVATANG